MGKMEAKKPQQTVFSQILPVTLNLNMCLCVNLEREQPDKIIYANMMLEKKEDEIPSGLWNYHQL